MRKTLQYAIWIVIAIISLILFYILLYTAFTPSSVSYADSKFLLRQMEWSNLGKAWHHSDMAGALINSAIIMIGSVVLSIVLSAGAGYVFARVNTWYNRWLFYLLLFSMMIPGIINTHWATILLLACGFIPTAVFLYTNFIRTLSREIEESAVMDGCTLFMAFWRTSFPLLLPITSTLIDYTQMAASALIGLLPAVTVYFIFQRYFIKSHIGRRGEGLSFGRTAGAIPFRIIRKSGRRQNVWFACVFLAWTE